MAIQKSRQVMEVTLDVTQGSRRAFILSRIDALRCNESLNTSHGNGWVPGIADEWRQIQRGGNIWGNREPLRIVKPMVSGGSK